MTEPVTTNVDVTLRADGREPAGRFPCPLCELELDLRLSKREKPYCVCNACGIQLFFRGKLAIARVTAIAERTAKQPRSVRLAAESVTAYSRLERLRTERTALAAQRAFLTTDGPLEHAIETLDGEIARIEEFLRTAARALVRDAGGDGS